MKHSPDSLLEVLLGKMLVDEEFRKEYARQIDLGMFTDKELFRIAQAMQEKDFLVEHLYLRNDKRIVVKCIELTQLYMKNKGKI